MLLVDSKINSNDTIALIESYYDKIEDLEDLLAIQEYESGKIEYASEKETNNLFDKLLA